MFLSAFVSISILFSASCVLCVKDGNETIRKKWMNVDSQGAVKDYLGRFKVFVDYVLKNGSYNKKGYSPFSLTAKRIIPVHPMRSEIISDVRYANYDQSLYNALRKNDNIIHISNVMRFNNEADIAQYVETNFRAQSSAYKTQESSYWKKLFKGIHKVYETLICCRLADLAITTFAEYRVLVAPPANARKNSPLATLLSENDAVLNYIDGKLDALNKLTGNGIADLIEKEDLPTAWTAATLDVTYIINDIRIPNMPEIKIPTQ